MYAFTADGTGLQVATYDGTNTKANVLRFVFSADGTPASAMQFSCFTDSTHTAPVAGAQNPVASHNDSLTNGFNPDSGTSPITSYIKINMYGSGLTAAGSQETPAAGTVGTMPTATTGAGGLTSTTAGDWLNTHVAWQSAQGFIEGIQAGAIQHATTAFNWYWDTLVFLGAGQTNGVWTFLYSIQYSFS